MSIEEKKDLFLEQSKLKQSGEGFVRIEMSKPKKILYYTSIFLLGVFLFYLKLKF